MIKTYINYIPKIQELYPTLAKEDIKRILHYGWSQISAINAFGADAIVQGGNDSDLWFYTGWLRRNSLKHFAYYKKKIRIKLRILYKRKKIQWDGYYYFGLCNDRVVEYTSQCSTRGRKRKHYNFNNITLYKIYDECRISDLGLTHIFRVKLPIELSFRTYQRKVTLTGVELIKVQRPVTFEDVLVNNNNYEFI